VEKSKKVRISFSKNNLSLIQKSLEEYIEYSNRKKFQHSIRRMSPVLEYVNKKENSSKEETVSLQIPLEYVGSIHDAVSDYALFYESPKDDLVDVLEYIEETIRKKMNANSFRSLNLSARTSFNVKSEIKEKAQ
jgi:hypothetical protein